MIKILITRRSCESDGQIVDVVSKIAEEIFSESDVEIIPNFTKHNLEDGNIRIIASKDELSQLSKSLEYIRIRFTNPRVSGKYFHYRLHVMINVQPSEFFRTF